MSETAISDAQSCLTILEIGAEGGSISVVARRGTPSVVEYSVRLRDQSLTFLNADEAGSEIRRDTTWTNHWNEAMKALGRWPWPMLGPVYIHPDYAERVLAAVESYRGRDGRPANEQGIARWRAACEKAFALGRTLGTS